MSRKANDSATTNSSSAVPKDQTKAIGKQANTRRFQVHCRSETRTLEAKTCDSIDEIKNAAYALYADYGFNDGNAILTYMDDENTEVLLIKGCDLYKKNSPIDLFLKFVHPGCAMCFNPFGVVDSQRLVQCLNMDCAAQYCNSCVQAIRGSPPEHPFTCIVCKKNVIPRSDLLIDKHILWKKLCEVYGIQELLNLTEESKDIFCYSILNDIQLRRVHLESRLRILRSRLNFPDYQRGEQDPTNSLDGQLIDDVSTLCTTLENLSQWLKEVEHKMQSDGIIVEKCLEKYKKGMKHFDRLCNTSSNTTTTTDVCDSEKEKIKQTYRMDDLNTLSSEQNIKTIDNILEDADFRQTCLLDSKTAISLTEGTPEQTMSRNEHLNKIQKKLQIIADVKEELKFLRGSLQKIKTFTDVYDHL